MSRTLAEAVGRLLGLLGPVLKDANPDDLPAHRAADQALPMWVSHFLEVMRKTQDGVSLKAIAEAITRRDLAAAEAAVNWDKVMEDLRARYQPAILDLMQRAADNTSGTLPPPPTQDLRLSFDLKNQRAQEWADAHAGELVKYIGDESKQAIRETVMQAFAEGGHPYQQAKRIRNVIGLLPNHATAVGKYHARLLGQGATEAEADKAAEKYAKKLLDYRAKNIARTETLTAANQGQIELWRQAREQGLLDATTRKAVVVTPDDRLCDVCAPMDGVTDTLDGDFKGMGDPPFHNSCRCGLALDFK